MKKNLFSRFLLQLLRVDLIRNIYCWIRYFFLKRNMRVLPKMTDGVGEYTVEHNMGALKFRAAFGMGNRMELLLYPMVAALRTVSEPKVLIVGPRTEDDLYWAKSLGVHDVRGLDLFSYSPWIDVGDIHKTNYEESLYDAVILGWVISYSEQPEVLVAECKRILKPGGFLGFGIESNPAQRGTGYYPPPRVNSLNSGKDIAKLVAEPVVFIHDPEIEVPTDNAILFQVMKVSV